MKDNNDINWKTLLLQNNEETQHFNMKTLISHKKVLTFHVSHGLSDISNFSFYEFP